MTQAKIIGNGVMKAYSEWLNKMAMAKPKYAQIVIIENEHFIVETILRLIKSGVIGEDALETALLNYK